MSSMQFWETIEATSTRPLDIAAASQRLLSALITKSPSEVLEFCREFDRKMEEAYTWELWGVAYLINGGCSDDSFLDFRSSLIAMGREVFENALRDAETLIDLDEGQLAEMFEEGYLYAPDAACEQLCGERPETIPEFKQEPSGERWQETRESLQAAFPRAWSVYGWEEEEPAEPSAPKKPWWKFW